MSSIITKTTIANRALQILGYQPISSLSDNSRGARAMNRAYDPVLANCLRANFWSFSIKRAILPAGGTAPSFGKANYFPLPGDFLMIAPPDQTMGYIQGGLPLSNNPSSPNNSAQYNDWQVESYPDGGTAIASDCTAPLYLRYVSSGITEGVFDPCFAEALAADLAAMTCEELTQSNTKLQNISVIRKEAIDVAKKRNAIEQMPIQPPVDPWILARM